MDYLFTENTLIYDYFLGRFTFFRKSFQRGSLWREDMFLFTADQARKP
jgi:hypothetical protein